MEAELVGPVTILAHAELLGQASCWGRRRGAPGYARSETATGRDAIDKRSLHPPGRTDKNLCRCFGAPARRVFPDHLIKRSLQTRSHAECTRGLLPSRRPPEAADYLNLPPVAGCRRCEASARSSDSRLHGRDGS